MHCIRKITDDFLWIGANDRRMAMFEGIYSVPNGVSYNAYLLLDEKTVLFDTVDKAVVERFMENLRQGLNDRSLDYFVVQHMEPDHTAALTSVIREYPNVKLIVNEKIAKLIQQFYNLDINDRALIVKENDTLSIGRRNLRFFMAPMVHWPEVMVTYDETEHILFSADAFGCFGALNGALFADEVDFPRDYLDEARRYYTNIVGKYGPQVQSALEKLGNLPIKMICPLHGFIWRENLGYILDKHVLWSTYAPEEQGVMIAYASIYGNTENAAEILACRLREKGVKTVMFDVSVTPAPDALAAAFKWSHLVFASPTYNMGIFVAMEDLINDLVAHNIQNRSVFLIENGSWAAVSGKLMKEKFEKCKNMKIAHTLTVTSSLKESQLKEIDDMAEMIYTEITAS